MTQQTPPGWKALRELAGLPQSEIERRCGMSRGRLSVIERGLIPTPEEERTLRRVLVAAIEQSEATA
jgi:transcriptional regulator with XRE-family HTH domain